MDSELCFSRARLGENWSLLCLHRCAPSTVGRFEYRYRHHANGWQSYAVIRCTLTCFSIPLFENYCSIDQAPSLLMWMKIGASPFFNSFDFLMKHRIFIVLMFSIMAKFYCVKLLFWFFLTPFKPMKINVFGGILMHSQWAWFPKNLSPLKSPLETCFFLRFDALICKTKNAVSVDLQRFASFCFAYWRRERDSNPRKLALQRFSRPPQSTTLPSLPILGLFPNANAKVYIYFKYPSVKAPKNCFLPKQS